VVSNGAVVLSWLEDYSAHATTTVNAKEYNGGLGTPAPCREFGHNDAAIRTPRTHAVGHLREPKPQLSLQSISSPEPRQLQPSAIISKQYSQQLGIHSRTVYIKSPPESLCPTAMTLPAMQ
jgi:hypothetical protein